MSIGSTIKRLRRERDITQEQLAEYLGITSRAVSQWECDRTAPDISQIPALCHVFGVSSDTLLGIDVEKSKEEIQKYLDKAALAHNDGDWAENVKILREAIRKFPRSYEIMHKLAAGILNLHSRKGIDEYDEVYALCNRILAECTDNSLRYDAMQTLACAYDYAGKEDEVMKIAKEMPRSHFSYENFMIYRWKGDEDFEEFQGYLSFLIYHTAEMMERAVFQRHDNGEFMYPAEDRIRLWKTEVGFLELLFPDGDYQMKAQLGEVACSFLSAAYLREQNYEEMWTWLEKGANFAIHMDIYDFDAPHTSPILRGYCDGGWIMEAEGNRSQSMLAWLTNDDETAVLRTDARYEILVDRLKKVAKKP